MYIAIFAIVVYMLGIATGYLLIRMGINFGGEIIYKTKEDMPLLTRSKEPPLEFDQTGLEEETELLEKE